jgi:Mg2+-importing ATPase
VHRQDRHTDGGRGRLDGAVDCAGQPSARSCGWPASMQQFQSGLANPLDEAVLAAAKKAGA